MIELLAVIAILAILAGILIPTVGAARASADKTRTRLQFTRWTAAVEAFRQEYGYYPALGANGKLATTGDALGFVRTLSGCNPDGSAVAVAADLNGNYKRLHFCAFSDGDFIDPGRPGGIPDFSGDELLGDAFGNIEIGVLTDRNGDGIIKPADDGPAAAVRGVTGGNDLTPADSDLPSTGIRAGVLFYSAGRGQAPGDMVLSWK